MQVAIDAQISPDVAGGTETALLSLIRALGRQQGNDRFLLIGMKAFADKLRPYMGPNQEVMVWPTTYRWYKPERDRNREMTPRWRSLRQAAGPLAPAVDRLHGVYAAGDLDMGPSARRFIQRWRIPAPIGARLHRLYKGVQFSREMRFMNRSHDHLLTSRGVRVVHFPYPLHFTTSLPFVYEPWGLPHFDFKELFAPGEPEWMDRMFRHGCDRAAVIVTATRWVKQDIVARYGIAPSKIAVIPRRPDFEAAVAPTDADVDSLYGLPRDFALFPAMTLPTKNHVRLIQAIARLRDIYGTKLNLICTGRTKTPQWPGIQSEIPKHGLQDQVKFLGAIPYSHLQRIFQRARFLVFPSLFEGFGLPLLEAFHAGLPVVASTAGSVREVVGDAGILFDPYDVDSIARALRQAATDHRSLESVAAKARTRLNTNFPTADRVSYMFTVCYRKAAGAGMTDADRKCLDEMLA